MKTYKMCYKAIMVQIADVYHRCYVLQGTFVSLIFIDFFVFRTQKSLEKLKIYIVCKKHVNNM